MLELATLSLAAHVAMCLLPPLPPGDLSGTGGASKALIRALKTLSREELQMLEVRACILPLAAAKDGK